MSANVERIASAVGKEMFVLFIGYMFLYVLIAINTLEKDSI